MQTDELSSYVKTNKRLIKEYLEMRFEVYKLKLIKMASKTAGSMIWIVVSLMLGFLLFTFIGIVIGFWMSEITNSFILGFGIATLIILAVIAIVSAFRRILFINPVIRLILKVTNEKTGVEKEKEEEYE